MLLSNLYLHLVLDLWFERVVKPRLRGEAYLIRYIDDFVICFQYREDAERVQAVLSKRLNKFALALEPSKTKLLRFGRSAQREARALGKKPETFCFLGFVHYCTRNRKGNFWSVRKVYCRVARYWYKMLCSRSWRGRFTWEVFNQVLERFPLQHPHLRLSYVQLQSHAVL